MNEIIFGILMGGFPVAVGVYALTHNSTATGGFFIFASFLIALIIEGNHK
jgi:hypothetical protein